MKILHIAPDPHARNGISKYSMCLESALRQIGCQIEACYLKDREICLGNIAKAARKITKKTDIVHIEIGVGTNSTFYYLFFFWLLRKKNPLILTLHDPPLVVFSPSLIFFKYKTAGLINKIFRKLILDFLFNFIFLKHLINKADCILVLNRGAILPTKNRFRHVEVRYCPLPCYKFESSPNQGKGIMFYGFLAPAKGLEELLLAISILRKKGTLILLNVVGGILDENYMSQIMNLVSSLELDRQVTFHGYVTDTEFNLIANNSMIGVFPYQETKSVSGSAAITELMGYGKAIICSDIPRFTNEFTKNEVIFYKSGDSNHLARKIYEILETPEVYENLKFNLNKALESRTLEKFAQNHIDIYQYVMHK